MFSENRPSTPPERAPDRSLVDRLLGLLVIGAVGVCLLTVIGLWWTGGRLVEESLRKQAGRWVVELDDLGTPLYVSTRREAAVQAIAERLKRFPEVAYVRYYDASGEHVLGEYSAIPRPPALAAEDARRADGVVGTEHGYVTAPATRGFVRVVAPVRVGRMTSAALTNLKDAAADHIRVVGYLDVGLHPGHERAVFLRSLLFGSLGLGGLFVVTVLAGRRTVRRALAPLTALQEPLARLARGDLEVQVGAGGDREIAAIRDALNATVTALKQREQALRRAQCDALTGLPNQHYFERQLELEHARIKRDGEASAVLYIDLDDFRHLNDDVGRSSGDRLLGQLAGVLRAHIRDDDLLSRLSGDAFVALVRRVDRDGAIKVARSMGRVIQEFQFTEGEEAFVVTASVGIALLDGESGIARALTQAKVACEQAKARGGNRYHMAELEDAAHEARHRQTDWSAHVSGAIRDNTLKLVYQPIVSLGKATGERYELLLRLQGTDGELIAPAAFLPLANRFGLLVEIDHWVIRHACAEVARLRADGREATFFINLSGQAFDDGEALARVVAEAQAAHQVKGAALVFEITEQVAVRHVDQARRVIEQLGKLGCRFALDDFGSGFSSLNYLKHLPVSFIKISGTFVEKVASDKLDELMVKSIIQIAQTLGMETIAESVEDRRTFQLLAGMQADFAQGHFIARPAEALPEPRFFQAERLRRLREVRSTPAGQRTADPRRS